MADPGICPTCGEQLSYGNFYLTENGQKRAFEGYYSVECSSKKCAFQGREFFALEYVTIGEVK